MGLPGEHSLTQPHSEPSSHHNHEQWKEHKEKPSLHRTGTECLAHRRLLAFCHSDKIFAWKRYILAPGLRGSYPMTFGPMEQIASWQQWWRTLLNPWSLGDQPGKEEGKARVSVSPSMVCSSDPTPVGSRPWRLYHLLTGTQPKD